MIFLISLSTIFEEINYTFAFDYLRAITTAVIFLLLWSLGDKLIPYLIKIYDILINKILLKGYGLSLLSLQTI